MTRRDDIAMAADAVAKKMVDDGRLIEAGWIGLQKVAYPDGVAGEQGKQLRTAFFAGAQHLMGSIMGIMDPESEPTDQDMKRMDLIDNELQAFIHEFMHAHKITDPDLGPEKGVGH